MSRKELNEIFYKVQDNSSCHQKYLKMLANVYKKKPAAEFIEEFNSALSKIFKQAEEGNLYIDRVLNFAAKFCANVTQREEQLNGNESHPFLTKVIQGALRYHNLNYANIRYSSCRFVTLTLQYIGVGVLLENDFCDGIQKAMLERIQDTKVSIRLQAIASLTRLQDPANSECLVTRAYLDALNEASSKVRRAVIEVIAATKSVLPIIIGRLRDVDSSVRLVAFRRCAGISPFAFKIAERHMILKCGFDEENKNVKKIFVDVLIPKWLTVYGANFLKFIAGLKLTADEEDLNQMIFLSKELIQVFYNKYPIQDMLTVLPINSRNKLIDIKDLTNEIVLYWRIITGLLRESDDMDDHLNSVLPELTPFCHYIQNLIQTRSQEEGSDWEVLEYQFNLLMLLEMTEEYDLSDEVGRRTLYALTTSVLQNHKMNTKITEALVKIAQKCSSNIDFLINDMCQVISEIREPLSEDKPSLNDNEKICHCLDVLSGILLLKEIIKLTPSLISCKNSFLVPQITSNNAEVHWKTLKCLALMSTIDKDTANEFAKVIAIPIATYRSVENYNTAAMIQSIMGVTDLLQKYGPEIISPENNSNTTSSQNSNKRALYSTNDLEDDNLSRESDNSMTLAYIIEIFLDMLDDECDEIRHNAAVAICHLILNLQYTTPAIISRIILKWYNPLIEKQDPKLQSCLGQLIEALPSVKNSQEMIKSSVVPTLSSICHAPRTSPIAEIDIDNLLHFYSIILNVGEQQNAIKFAALDILIKISENPNDRIVVWLTRLLGYFDLPKENIDSYVEIIKRSEDLLKKIQDKLAKKNLEKFIYKLKNQETLRTSETINTMNESGNQETTTTSTESRIPTLSFKAPFAESTRNRLTSNTDSNENLLSPNNHHHQSPEKKNENLPPSTSRHQTPQVKRKKRGSKNECIVLLEKIEIVNNSSQCTTLHTIVEDSMEMMSLEDNLTIETPTSSSSTNSAESRKQIVVAETSDSEHSNETVSSTRRSRRIRKKRIL